MIPGSKGLNPHELAHMWMKDLLTPTLIYDKLILYPEPNFRSRFFNPDLQNL